MSSTLPSNPYDTIRIEDGEATRSIAANGLSVSDTEDFLRIVPLNQAAQLAFHEVALCIEKDSTWQTHSRRFVYINSEKTLIDDATKMVEMTTDTSDEDGGVHATQQAVFNGYFRLSINTPPQDPRKGWIIGSGRVKLKQYPDLFISVDRVRDQVRGKHALIYFNSDTKALMIRAFENKSISVGVDHIGTQGRVIPNVPVNIEIGRLGYKIEYATYDKKRFLEMRDGMLPSISQSLYDTMESTPGDSTFVMHGYEHESPKAHGAYGMVFRCRSREGVYYAMKRLKRVTTNVAAISLEIKLWKEIGYHPNVCSLVEVQYSDGTQDDTGGSPVNDVYMYLTPWAPMTAESLSGSSQSTIARLLQQVVSGLEWLHNKNIIHRDLKPSNILYIPVPEQWRITDFGCALKLPEGEVGEKDIRDLTDHRRGTVHYLPPEIMALKHMANGDKLSEWRRLGSDGDGRDAQWSKACDIYSVGLSVIQLLSGVRTFKKTDIPGMLSRTRLRALLLQMVFTNPGLRPTCDQVLADVDLNHCVENRSTKRGHVDSV